MHHLSLCSGYGGLDLALHDAIGARTVAFAEFEDAPSRVLAHRFPGVLNLGDVTAITWRDWRGVDIISGGTPCQDLSTAGRRRGMSEGTRSNLWTAMREGIATVRPRFVVWENVRGAFTAPAERTPDACRRCTSAHEVSLRALGRVLGDLHNLGYDARWYGIRASEVGFAHQRFRVFVIAHRPGDRFETPEPFPITPTLSPSVPTPTVADASGSGGGYESGSLSSYTLTDVIKHRKAAPPMEVFDAVLARHAATLGRSMPCPSVSSTMNQPVINPMFSEWLMGLPAGWITQVDGISRLDAIRMSGNGVVPRQASQALRLFAADTRAILGT